MINSSIAETGDISSTSSVFCSFRALSIEDKQSMHRFYLGLNFDERRRRFGGAVSDEWVTRYCATIDWKQIIILACFGTKDIFSIVELHPVSSRWNRAELALVCKRHSDSQTIIAHLLQVAVFAAGKVGCRKILLSTDQATDDTLCLLRDMGSVAVDPEYVTVDLGEYSKMQGYVIEADRRMVTAQ
jgi:hypothetical protein